MTTLSAGAKFRAALAAESPLQVIGAINANHALLAKRAGFRAIYLSGGGVAAGSGVPADSAQLDEILGAAEGTLDGSTAVTIEEKGAAGWKVTVVEGSDEQEVRVSQDLSTEVTETEQDDQDVDPASVEVSMADAIEAASADQDGTVTEVSLDEDDGTIAWQVEFDDEIDVDVDASSGDVIGVDR